MIAFPPDFSFYIQIASFFLLVVALRELLFQPVMRVLDERTARTIGVRAEAEAAKRASDDSARVYDRRLEEIRRQLAGETESARVATAAEERTVLAAAQERAGVVLTARRQALREQGTQAREVLGREAESIARRMVDKVVGRSAA